MSVKQNIDAGKYLPNLPYAGAGPKMGEHGLGDYLQLAIAKVDVYPPGYDPFNENNKNKPKAKPTYEYYLDLLTVAGPLRYRLNIADRKEGDALLEAENARIRQAVYNDLLICYGSVDALAHETLFDLAWKKRLGGLHQVVAYYDEHFPLIA